MAIKEAAEMFPTPAYRQNVVSFLLSGDMPQGYQETIKFLLSFIGRIASTW